MKNKYHKISKYIFNCKICPTRCDGISKGAYNFSNDLEFSEKYENLVIKRINKNQNYIASKCQKDAYPDIEIKYKTSNKIKSYLEIKVQRRTFMSVTKILPNSGLEASETLALNLSDLLRYFKIQKETKTPTSILWILMNRPCIVKPNEISFYYQSTKILEEIYLKHGVKRRFKRKVGKGDIIDGIHKGVVVNYHFSLNELVKWNIESPN